MFKKITEFVKSFIYASQATKLYVTGEQQLKPTNSLEEYEACDIKNKFKSVEKIGNVLNLFNIELIYNPINFDDKCALYCARHVDMDCDYELFEKQIEYLGAHSFRHFEAFMDPAYGLLSIQDLGDRFDARLYRKATNDKYFISIDGHCVIGKGKLENFKTVLNTSLLTIVTPLILTWNSYHRGLYWEVEKAFNEYGYEDENSLARQHGYGVDMTAISNIHIEFDLEEDLDVVMNEFLCNEETFRNLNASFKRKNNGTLPIVLRNPRFNRALFECTLNIAYRMMLLVNERQVEANVRANTIQRYDADYSFTSRKEHSPEKIRELLLDTMTETVDLNYTVNLEKIEEIEPKFQIEQVFEKIDNKSYILISPFEVTKVVKGYPVYLKETLREEAQKGEVLKPVPQRKLYNYCTNAKFAINNKNYQNVLIEEAEFDAVFRRKKKAFVNGVKVYAKNNFIFRFAALTILNVNKNFISPILDRHFACSIIESLHLSQDIGTHKTLDLDFRFRKELDISTLYKDGNYLKSEFISPSLFLSRDKCFIDERGVKHKDSIEWITAEILDDKTSALKNLYKAKVPITTWHDNDDRGSFLEVLGIKTKVPFSAKEMFFYKALQIKNPNALETYQTVFMVNSTVSFDDDEII